MALYNFKKRFEPDILSGRKRHTIRAKRKRATKVGEMCHLYTGLRQKGAQLLMRTLCTKVEEIQIFGGILAALSVRPLYISIDGVGLSLDESEQLARSDGFESLLEMCEFWRGRTPFIGDIIHWSFPPETQSNKGNPWQDSVKSLAARTSSKAKIYSAPMNVAEATTTKNAARCAMQSDQEKRPARSAD